MKEKSHWLERLTDKADLFGETGLSESLVELAGDRRVLIEHHQGVIRYGREKICVKVKYGTVAVIGCGLEMACMTRQQLIICGRIDSIELHRRGK